MTSTTSKPTKTFRITQLLYRTVTRPEYATMTIDKVREQLEQFIPAIPKNAPTEAELKTRQDAIGRVLQDTLDIMDRLDKKLNRGNLNREEYASLERKANLHFNLYAKYAAECDDLARMMYGDEMRA